MAFVLVVGLALLARGWFGGRAYLVYVGAVLAIIGGYGLFAHVRARVAMAFVQNDPLELLASRWTLLVLGVVVLGGIVAWALLS